MTGEFAAQWDSQLALSWTYAYNAPNHEYTIRAPQGVTLNQNQKYILNCTLLNRVEEKDGFEFPDTQGTYYATIDVFQGGTQVETGT